MNHGHGSHDEPRRRPNMNWILIAFLAIAGFFLFTEHRAHLFGFLPFLLLLACPLMHLFMHGGHGHGHGGDEQSGSQKADTKNSQKGN